MEQRSKNVFDSSVEFIKGVGAYRAKGLNALNIYTFRQMMEYYPFRYVDKTRFSTAAEVASDEEYYQIRGVVRSIEEHGEGSKKRMIAVFRDHTSSVDLVFFRGLTTLTKWLHVGSEYIIYGKPEIFNHRVSFVHPEIEPAYTPQGEPQRAPSAFSPVYYCPKELEAVGLDSKGISKIMRALFEKVHARRQELEETLPQAAVIGRFGFMPRYEAILRLHFPQNQEQLQEARRRLKFEELFYLQFKVLKSKVARQAGIAGLCFDKIGNYFNTFYQTGLKFDLTNAQKRVLREIRRDLGSGLQMNRLLQGDVGSGKTVVAFMTMLMAIDNGFQAALIAPTEILAQQHYQSINPMAHALGLQAGILTGSIKSRLRKNMLRLAETGQAHILIGTHAILESKVVFKNMGLAIIDEQHRFGVAQRAKMWEKNQLAPPHILVMTATPIPRTLAMTVYGDLDVSVIDEMPPGRIPIRTYHKYESQRLWVFGLMREEIARGRQVYVVYPLIDESESETLADVKNLTEGAEAIAREFPQPQYQISIVHGRQDAETKDYEMQRFVKGETHIMVATTVIEVGVNVPNATVMVIENSERFGLAQLHQLRGRVGRGGGEAHCVLMTGFKLSSDSKFRMQTMCESTDGFYISEADLKLRGPGNIEGTQQSGVLNLRIADLVRDAEIMQLARQTAEGILEEDPGLQNPDHVVVQLTLDRQRDDTEFSKIS